MWLGQVLLRHAARLAAVVNSRAHDLAAAPARAPTAASAPQALVRRFPKSHPFANLSGTENIISFTTLRYRCVPRGWAVQVGCWAALAAREGTDPFHHAAVRVSLTRPLGSHPALPAATRR